MKQHLIVTVFDDAYWPGGSALYESYLRHSRAGFDFAAIVYGSNELVTRAEARGMRVVHNPKFPVDELPTGKHHTLQETMPAMYGRLLAPSLFSEYDRIIYVDADSIILQSMRPLSEMQMHHPIAATRCNGPITSTVHGRSFSHAFGPMSSMFVIDRAIWGTQKIDRKWIDAVSDSTLRFPYTVEGVFHLVMGTSWHCLPWPTQAHAGHDTFDSFDKSEIYTLHFMGTNPWDEIPVHLLPYPPHKERARALWRKYVCES